MESQGLVVGPGPVVVQSHIIPELRSGQLHLHHRLLLPSAKCQQTDNTRANTVTTHTVTDTDRHVTADRLNLHCAAEDIRVKVTCCVWAHRQAQTARLHQAHVGEGKGMRAHRQVLHDSW